MRIITFIALLFTIAVSAQERLEVFFDFDRYELNEQAATRINNFISGKNPVVSRIYGYCDWKGSNAYNDTLSVKRVNAVYEFLTRKGISIRENYEIIGFGEDFNQSPIQSENRKVVIVFEESGKGKPNEQTLTEAVKGLKQGEKVRLENINFHNNSAVIVNRSKPALYELLCIMEENPTLKIEIQGHICCQLSTDVHDVSTSRARAIYNFLLRNKISKKRLSYKGFGVTQPIHPIPEKSEAEADENRRVEIMIVER
ncbi:MAG TPA: OmpA family protein [Flavobacterium sp.]|jgi:outer membrane protein OmpA-like peptidoglycan-associated protein